METADAFRSEIVRPVVTLVTPGAVATWPYFIELARIEPALRQFFDQHRTAGLAAALLTVLAVGLILEDIGSLIEERILDEILSRRLPNFRSEWRHYLQVTFQPEPIGQRYLRGIHLRLKFELGMGPALVLSAIGLVWVGWNNQLKSTFVGVVTPVLLVTLATYLLWESLNSATVLANTRGLLLKSLDNAGHPASVESSAPSDGDIQMPAKHQYEEAPRQPNQWMIDVNAQYQKVVDLLIGLATGALVLPPIFLKSYLAVTSQPLLIFMDAWAYWSIAAFFSTIGMGMVFHLLSAKCVKSAWARETWMSQRNLGLSLGILLSLMLLSFLAGLLLFVRFVLGT